MPRLKITWFLLLVGISIQRTAIGDNYVIMMKPTKQPPANMIHVSEWQANLRGADVVLHWNCHDFQSVDKKGIRYDADISLSVLAERGRIQASPSFSQDRTDIRKKDTKATVATSIAGVGHVRMRLQLELIDEFPAAGEYINTVELSVTGH